PSLALPFQSFMRTVPLHEWVKSSILISLLSDERAAKRAEEWARANTLRAQIDELNAALEVANAEDDRALTEERQRADRLNKQVEALSAEVMRAEEQAEAAIGRVDRAEASRDAERARAWSMPAVGDVPLVEMRFRCANCGSRLTDFVVTATEATGRPR